MTRRQIGVIAGITMALAGLIATGVWALSQVSDASPMMGGGYSRASGHIGDGFGMMGAAGMMDGMMDGTYGVAGTGPVASLGQARSAAQGFADGLGLRVGEVMEFSNGFYAELVAPAGSGATEVLVDAEDGDVRIEYGPAMMWNTEYGVHVARAAPSARVSADEAQKLADRWLAGRGLTAGEPEEFPGYYTLHTLRAGKITGMLSVNAYTGAVWYHSWHGEFVDMSA